jgi:hypothetical protein
MIASGISGIQNQKEIKTAARDAIMSAPTANKSGLFLGVNSVLHVEHRWISCMYWINRGFA